MSGHSKWHSIRHKKGAADAKRGKAFSKLSKQITVCARDGGSDLAMNFSLRLAIEKAKAANMPKDNIERAIKKGSGEDSGEESLKSAVYEGMGPGGAAVIVEALTDNVNRTIATVKTAFNKNGGNLEAKVMWLFERKGVTYIEDVTAINSLEEFELTLIDAGADDVQIEDNTMRIMCEVKSLKSIIDTVGANGTSVMEAGIEYVPNDAIELSEEDRDKLETLLEVLEEDEDVSSVFTNVK